MQTDPLYLVILTVHLYSWHSSVGFLVQMQRCLFFFFFFFFCKSKFRKVVFFTGGFLDAARSEMILTRALSVRVELISTIGITKDRTGCWLRLKVMMSSSLCSQAQSSNDAIQRRSPRNENEIDRELEMTEENIQFEYLVRFHWPLVHHWRQTHDLFLTGSTQPPSDSKCGRPVTTQCISVAEKNHRRDQIIFDITEVHSKTIEDFLRQSSVSMVSCTREEGNLTKTFHWKTSGVESKVAYCTSDSREDEFVRIRRNEISDWECLPPLCKLDLSSCPLESCERCDELHRSDPNENRRSTHKHRSSDPTRSRGLDGTMRSPEYPSRSDHKSWLDDQKLTSVNLSSTYSSKQRTQHRVLKSFQRRLLLSLLHTFPLRRSEMFSADELAPLVSHPHIDQGILDPKIRQESFGHLCNDRFTCDQVA